MFESLYTHRDANIRKTYFLFTGFFQENFFKATEAAEKEPVKVKF